jgi:hypothetical protein
MCRTFIRVKSWLRDFMLLWKKITIYVLGPELDGLPHTRRKLTKPLLAEELPAEFPP